MTDEFGRKSCSDHVRLGGKKYYFFESGDLTLSNMGIQFEAGIGQISRLSDTGEGKTAVEMAELANKIQKHFVEKWRNRK